MFILRKRKKVIKDRIIADIWTHIGEEEEDYFKPERVSSFWNINCIKYESNSDRNKDFSLEEYL